MKKTVQIAAVLMSLLSATINAQDNDEVKYIPKSNMAKKEKQKKEAASAIFKKNYAAFELSLLGRGVAALSYERLVAERITVGIGIGTSFMKDVIALYVSSLATENNNDPYSYAQLMGAKTSFKSGKLFLNGSVKYLFGDNEDRFYYLGLDFRKWGYITQINSTAIDMNQILNINNSDINFDFTTFSIKWGARRLSDGDKIRFYADYYFGIGAKFTKYDKLIKSGTTYDPITLSEQDVFTKTTQNFASIYLMGGLTLGIAF